MSDVRVAAIDLGASSGRVMVADIGPDRLEMHAAARFPNRPLRLPSGLHWDVPGLYAAAIDGLREAARGGPITSIGIDSWAVDYGLLRDGRLLGLPSCYRDEERGAVGPERVHDRVDRAALYARNGLQFLPFSTLYQFAADPWLDQADRALLVPDLIAHWLTGAQVAERTNASTTGLLEARTREWDRDLLDRLAFPQHLLAPLVDPGEPIGTLLPDVADEVGAPAQVVAVGSHDTASAVLGVPMADPHTSAYVSLGTWGLVGLELDAPVLSEAASRANFTNEGGVDGTTRFLTNVMGTFVLSECLREWTARGVVDDAASALPDLLRAAAAHTSPVDLLDVQDPRFASPGDQPSRIAAWYAERDLSPPGGPVAMVRAIVLSLAAAYAEALETASRLAGHPIEVVHVVGGGARNDFLCQALADAAGRPVLAGPVEATALGNVLVQARAAGAVGAARADLRALIARHHAPVRYAPTVGR